MLSLHLNEIVTLNYCLNEKDQNTDIYSTKITYTARKPLHKMEGGQKGSTIFSNFGLYLKRKDQRLKLAFSKLKLFQLPSIKR